jgi:glycosyltransferase involved in cell wall biosynthesis
MKILPKHKIVHIFKATGVSGSENHLLTLLPELNKKFDVYVILLIESTNQVDELKAVLEENGITVYRVIIKHHLDFFVILKIYSLIKKIRPNIAHTHLVHADIYGTLSCRIARVPRIISSKHNHDPFRAHPLFKLVSSFVSRYHDRIIAISESLKEFLYKVEGIDKEKITVIKYGLNPEKLASVSTKLNKKLTLRDEFKIPHDYIIIGNVARLISQKGYPFLIDAFHDLVKEGFKIVLIIVGEGLLREELQNQVQDLGLEDKVFFTGYRTDVIQLMDEFDIFVFPSIWEGFGLVLLEAMSLGKPIISSNVGAIPEIVIDGETGFLVMPRDVLGLRNVMKKLIESPDLRKSIGEKGRERLKAEFSVEKMVKKTEKLYNKLL